MPTEEEDAALLARLGQIGAALSVARDPDTDPDLAAGARHAAEQAMAAVTDQHRQETQE